MADGYLSKSWLKNFPCKSILLQCSFLSSEMNRMQFLNICQNAWSLILHSDLSLKFDCIQDGWELNADRMIHVAPNLDDSHWRLLIVHHENFIPVVFETSLLTYLWWFYLTCFFFVFFMDSECFNSFNMLISVWLTVCLNLPKKALCFSSFRNISEVKLTSAKSQVHLMELLQFQLVSSSCVEQSSCACRCT